MKIWEVISWGFDLQIKIFTALAVLENAILHPHKISLAKFCTFTNNFHTSFLMTCAIETLHPQTVYHLPDQLTKKTHLTPIFSDYSACGPNRFSGSGSTYRLWWDVQGRSCVWVCKCVCVWERWEVQISLYVCVWTGRSVWYCLLLKWGKNGFRARGNFEVFVV